MSSLVFSLKAGGPRGQDAPLGPMPLGNTVHMPAGWRTAGPTSEDDGLGMSSYHYGKTQGQATGVEKVEEAKQCLFLLQLWGNVSVLKSGPRTTTF